MKKKMEKQFPGNSLHFISRFVKYPGPHRQLISDFRADEESPAKIEIIFYRRCYISTHVSLLEIDDQI